MVLFGFYVCLVVFWMLWFLFVLCMESICFFDFEWFVEFVVIDVVVEVLLDFLLFLGVMNIL